MNTRKMIGSLLAGAAIGVALGILLAPQSGKRTRRKLVHKSKRLKESFRGSVEDSVQSLKDRFNSGVDELVKSSREMMDQANEEAKFK